MVSVVAVFSLICVPDRITTAQEKDYFTRGSLGISTGIWKPYSLDKYPSKPFKQVQGSYPTLGFTAITPSFQSYAIRASIFQWMQNHPADVADLESITLLFLSFDFINYVITQSRIGPFISLGPAIVWSREIPENSPNKEAISLDRAGYGFNVGTGLEIQIISHLGIVVEYQYHYCNFSKKVGNTNNYSGPHLSFKCMFLF